MDFFIDSIIDHTVGFTFPNLLVAVGVALVLGFIISFVHSFKTKSSQSFLLTLAVLPAMVAVIILLVNGNIGTGVAIAGAFSLIRFRSQPGTGKEISSIFLAMVTGLACGSGFVGVGILITVILGVVEIVCVALGFGKEEIKSQCLTVLIPENLDYTEIFDEVFEKYLSSCERISIKTTNMGSMYKIRYDIIMKNPADEKKFIDDIRVRNGNLEVMLHRNDPAGESAI